MYSKTLFNLVLVLAICLAMIAISMANFFSLPSEKQAREQFEHAPNCPKHQLVVEEYQETVRYGYITSGFIDVEEVVTQLRCIGCGHTVKFNPRRK